MADPIYRSQVRIVRCLLRIPAGTRAGVDRAPAKHPDECPTAATLRGAMVVSGSAEIEEV